MNRNETPDFREPDELAEDLVPGIDSPPGMPQGDIAFSLIQAHRAASSDVAHWTAVLQENERVLNQRKEDLYQAAVNLASAIRKSPRCPALSQDRPSLVIISGELIEIALEAWPGKPNAWIARVKTDVPRLQYIPFE